MSSSRNSFQHAGLKRGRSASLKRTEAFLAVALAAAFCEVLFLGFIYLRNPHPDNRAIATYVAFGFLAINTLLGIAGFILACARKHRFCAWAFACYILIPLGLAVYEETRDGSSKEIPPAASSVPVRGRGSSS